MAHPDPGPPEQVTTDLRKLSPAHLPELLELWRSAGLTIRPAGRERPDILQCEMEQFPDNFIGAFAGDRLVGVVIASWDGRRGWINRIAVHPELRHRGIARALIAAAEAELQRRGALVIAALVEPDNTTSLALFREAGYRDTPSAVYLSKRKAADV